MMVDSTGRGSLGLGMGTHGDSSKEEEILRLRRAIKEALQMGVRSFDTAHHYREGHAETILGEILDHAAVDEVVVTTKVGFVDAPQSLTGSSLRQYLAERYPSLKNNDELALERHCLAPSFILACLEITAQRLRRRRPNRVLVHNPETQLTRCSLEALEAQLTEVFRIFEDSYRRNEIGGYGIATWQALIIEPEFPYHLSLERLVALARQVGGTNHGFRTVMLPLYPGLPDAATVESQEVRGQRYCALDAASELGLEVHIASPFGQKPLNAIDTTRCLELLSRMCADPSIHRVFAGMCSTDHLQQNVECARSSGVSVTGTAKKWLLRNMS